MNQEDINKNRSTTNNEIEAIIKNPPPHPRQKKAQYQTDSFLNSTSLRN
jgi:hypothetical protein